MTNKTEVLIIGAGPVGLLSAYALTCSGIRVRIIEKNTLEERKNNEARAITLNPRSIEILDALGLKEDYIKEGRVCRCFTRQIGRKKVPDNTFDYWDQLHTESPYFIHLPQWKMEDIIAKKLADLGVNIERGCEFQTFTRTNDSITAYVTKKSAKESIKANYLIGCDGSQSLVRKAMGVELVTHVESEIGFYQIDAKIIPFPNDNSHRFMFVLKGVTMTVLPLFDDYMRIVIFFRKGDPRFDNLRPELFNELLFECGFGKISLHDPLWNPDYRPKSSLATNLYLDRVFIAGDAVHPISPITAQGVNTGFQDAYNLCWKLIFFLRQQGSTKLIESYHQERHQAGEQLIKHAHEMTVLFKELNEGGKPGQIKRRMMKTKTFFTNYLKTQSQLFVTYKESQILQKTESAHQNMIENIHSGLRFPNFTVSAINGKVQIYSYSSYQSLLLIIFSGGADFHIIDEMLRLKNEMEKQFYKKLKALCVIDETLSPSSFEKSNSWPDYVVIDTSTIHKTLQIKKPCMMLLRPDNYIASIYPLEDQKGVEKFLENYFSSNRA